jgi:hypothetical protein
MTNFIEQITSRIAGLVLALAVSVYAAGFVIVNAYLSQFNLSQVEMFQPAFISAGLLFFLLMGVAFTVVWPVARLISKVFEKLDSTLLSGQTTPQNYKWTQFFDRSRFLGNFGLIVLVLLTIGLLLYAVYWIETLIGNIFMMQMITWANRGTLSGDIFVMSSNISRIAQLQGFIALLTFLLVQNWKVVGHTAKDLALACSVVLFLLVQTWCLLVFADKVYGSLPNTIGGGQPQYVVLYVSAEVAGRMDALDDSFLDHTDAIVSTGTIAPNTVKATNTLTLFWQIKSVSLEGKDENEVYFVRPTQCEQCPVIKIYGSDIFSIAYISSPK